MDFGFQSANLYRRQMSLSSPIIVISGTDMHNAETITEVALSTGFCDQSHFIKQFEKQVGLPPLTYKLYYHIRKDRRTVQLPFREDSSQ